MCCVLTPFWVAFPAHLTVDATAWGIGWVSCQTLNFQSSVPHSDTVSLKARLTEINLPCRNHILLDINQWAKLSSVFLHETDGSRAGKKIPALGWNRSGQGRFQTQVERHRGLPRGQGPSAALPEWEFWESSGGVLLIWDRPRGASGCTGWEGREAVSSSSCYLPCPIPHLSLTVRGRSQINTSSAERAREQCMGRHGFKAHSVTDMLWDLGTGRAQFPHPENGKIGADP